MNDKARLMTLWIFIDDDRRVFIREIQWKYYIISSRQHDSNFNKLISSTMMIRFVLSMVIYYRNITTHSPWHTSIFRRKSDGRYCQNRSRVSTRPQSPITNSSRRLCVRENEKTPFLTWRTQQLPLTLCCYSCLLLLPAGPHADCKASQLK